MPGESIGRFGPLTTYGGRTEGQPCTGLLDVCDDHDVNAWLEQAKHWTALAKQVRETVVETWGPDIALWPQKVGFGEISFNESINLLAGEQGWLDSSKVANAIEVQRLAKTAMELWFQALEQKYGKPLEVDPEGLGYDGLSDPENLPPVIVPELPELPNLGLGGVGGVLRMALWGGGLYLAYKVLVDK
ncbi:hypothetical protein [Nannocystis pusilla]|uniref:Uncharacterized protein n=1 Tax=Nannocystis pusilla TaxID=889268 RepID=A0ABS7U3Y4_9BACT|nr:hypothetical protein [Nannocystis pusilla]MBZ5715275.1 hypothetical protein [Nannocystis pusilla]